DATSHWLNDGRTRLALRLGTLGLLLIVWQLAGDDTIALLFPTFTRTLEAFTGLVADGSLPMALLITNQTLVAGFALAGVLGVAIGVLSASMPIVDRTITPYFTLLVAIPIIALVPVVQALMGLSFQARMTIVTLFAIPYIVIKHRRSRPQGRPGAAGDGQKLWVNSLGVDARSGAARGGPGHHD